jgi:glycosyltransferase involved in cell wall biosynthesis
MISSSPLVSVIVPVFNVAFYLERCINSLVAQTYDNIEIILVDDGSTDDSPQLCDACAGKYSRIKVIHKKNGGLSDARNVGIETASGEYLSFVDSDDVVHPEFIMTLVAAIEKSRKKMAICLFQSFSDNKPLGFHLLNKSIQVLNLYDAICAYCSLSPEKSTPLISCCTKMYHRSLFNYLRFPVGRIYEDALVSYKLLDEANDVVFVGEPLYGYYMRNDSIMGQKERHSSKDVLKPYHEAIKYFAQNNKEEIAQLFYPPLVMREIYRYWIAKVQNKDEQDAIFLLGLMKEDCRAMCSCKNVAFKLKMVFSLIVKYPFLYSFYRKIAPGFLGGR